jgi:asparaginyl-tRNA synthetase
VGRGQAKALLKYTFAASLNEREKDLALFDRRIGKGPVAKLAGIVGSEFVHMDYGEAIRVLERANEKFEFPVQWGVDLQSEHERYLTEKYAKKRYGSSRVRGQCHTPSLDRGSFFRRAG